MYNIFPPVLSKLSFDSDCSEKIELCSVIEKTLPLSVGFCFFYYRKIGSNQNS